MHPRGLSGAELSAVTALWARTGRTIEARFTGTSMAPAVPDGATLRLQCGEPVHAGDVAALVHDGHVLLHRVVAVREPFLLTRGDALVIPDPPLPLDLAFARVEAVQRAGAWIAPDAHDGSLAQRLVLALCAFHLGFRWTRVLIAVLRRLRRRPSVSQVDILG